MGLRKYFKKRDLKKSGEPEPIIPKTAKKIFVVHEHFASHHHFDFRIQMNGVLKSWAIPKQLPRSKNLKRLAIQVEDHPLSYANFKGTIPEGNYGAGKVEIWDKGTYQLIEKDAKKIVLELKGKILTGKYCLVKTKYGSKPEKSWLFFKI